MCLTGDFNFFAAAAFIYIAVSVVIAAVKEAGTACIVTAVCV